MNKVTIFFVVLAIIAVGYAKCCKADEVKLSNTEAVELSYISIDLLFIPWSELDQKAEKLIARADDMSRRIAERIARIEKFQEEHGHK